MSLLGSFDIGATGLTAQAMRLNVISSNIANVDSVSGPMGVHTEPVKWFSQRCRVPIQQGQAWQLPRFGKVVNRFVGSIALDTLKPIQPVMWICPT